MIQSIKNMFTKKETIKQKTIDQVLEDLSKLREEELEIYIEKLIERIVQNKY